MAYHNFSNGNLGIDKLLQQYRSERDAIVSLMNTSPDTLIKTLWDYNGCLAIDTTCQCKMGAGDYRSPFACTQCRNFRRLLDMKNSFVDKPFCLQCGQVAGKSMLIKKYDIDKPILQWDTATSEKLAIISNKYPSQISKCISGDSFTISTLINFIVNDKLREKGIPSNVLHTAFVCHKNAYHVFDASSIGTLEDLHTLPTYHTTEHKNVLKSQHIAYSGLLPDIAHTIIQQLLVNITELSKYNFFHGLPSSQNLLFNKEPVSYIYNNYHVKGNITLLLSNFEKSSINYNGVRYFTKDPRNYIATTLLPDINTNVDNGITYVKITSRTLDLYYALSSMGVSLYPGMLDLYAYMVSLMCDESFYDSVHNTPRLSKIWQNMWLPNELPNIESNIKRIHGHVYPNQYVASDVAYDIVRGNWLRSDIITHMWKVLQEN